MPLPQHALTLNLVIGLLHPASLLLNVDNYFLTPQQSQGHRKLHYLALSLRSCTCMPFFDLALHAFRCNDAACSGVHEQKRVMKLLPLSWCCANPQWMAIKSPALPSPPRRPEKTSSTACAGRYHTKPSTGHLLRSGVSSTIQNRTHCVCGACNWFLPTLAASISSLIPLPSGPSSHPS